MDGINFSNLDIRSGGVSGTQSAQGKTSLQKSDGTQSDFVQTLKNAINNVDGLQKESDLKMQQLATGQNTNIHETMIAAEKADIAMRLMVQVRNKIIEAYQEIMRMQV
ncbi:MAG: flagellar hook-basal body complex protein FliE [Bdellovibrionales bacterium]